MRTLAILLGLAAGACSHGRAAPVMVTAPPPPPPVQPTESLEAPGGDAPEEQRSKITSDDNDADEQPSDKSKQKKEKDAKKKPEPHKGRSAPKPPDADDPLGEDPCAGGQ